MTDLDAARTALREARTSATDLLASLTRDFAGIVEASADSNADDEHDPEGSTIAFERAQVSTLIDQAHRNLAEIDAAAGRVDDGTYGSCEVCGADIAEARLEARPTARTCIACASPTPR